MEIDTKKTQKLVNLGKAREAAAKKREEKKKALEDSEETLRQSLRIEEVAPSPHIKKRYVVKTPMGRLVHFGDKSKDIFQDSTDLKLFVGHGDEKKKESYISRAKKTPIDKTLPKDQWESAPKAYQDPESELFYVLKYFY